MELGKLKPAIKAKTVKRVGRGIGSGLGKTSGRGHGGQRSRSGYSGGTRPGFEGGQTPLYRRLPKRGFTNIHGKEYTEITLTMLNNSKATEVTAETLVKDGIVSKVKKDGIVILATGNLEKKLTVKASRFTKTAQEKIEAVGGKTEVI